MTPNVFLAYLTEALTAGESVSEIGIDRITTLTGEEIATSDFAIFGRGILTINPDANGDTSFVEYASFTGVDAVDPFHVTGVTRGLSAKSDTSSADRMHYYPVGTRVVISFGSHNVQDLIDYVNDLFDGVVGSASDTSAGTTKITEPMGTHSRAVSSLVHEQDVPDMTVFVRPFGLAVLNSFVNFVGGSSPTITAPVSNPRIDLVVYNVDDAAVKIRGGSEGASPSEPTPTSGDIVLASIYLRTGSTVIRDRDASTNAYIKRWFQPDLYRTNILTTAFEKFGGDGSDGALAISGGTTTLDLGGARTYVKNYTSISITGTGALAFSNPHAEGTAIILKSQGDVTLTSSAAPMIDASGMGANGNQSPGSVSGSGASTSNGGTGTAGFANGFFTTNAGLGATSSAGTQGAIPTALTYSTLFFNSLLAAFKYSFMFWLGAGGGAGSAYNNSGSSHSLTGGTGGKGGGFLLIECAGAWNFTTAGGISVAGKPGSNATGTGGVNFKAGGGGGGAGGFLMALYNTLTANSGTVTVAGGTVGTDTSGSGNAGPGGGGANAINPGSSGAGGAGLAYVAKNTEFF